MDRQQLAKRLRWLAEQHRQADARLQAQIERAFRRGYERGVRV